MERAVPKGAASPFLSNQKVLVSSILRTVMENSASSSTGRSPANSIFCSKYKIHTEAKNKEHVENILEECLQKGRDVHKRLDEFELLVSEHEQEMAALADKTNNASSYANSLQCQMEIIQEQTRNQNSVNAHQVNHLESTVSQLHSELQEAKRMYEDKVSTPVNSVGSRVLKFTQVSSKSDFTVLNCGEFLN